MKRLFPYFVLVMFGVFVVSCHSADTVEEIPIRPYAEQYPVDLAAIDKYLDENHMDVNPITFEVNLTAIPTPNTSGLLSIRQQTDYPLQYKIVNRNNVDYKVYYISFREGQGERPVSVDSTFVTYKGYNLKNESFDSAQNPTWFTLDAVIPGWSSIVPLFKASDSQVSNSDGTVTYNNFGAGLMFLPSGLGYYSSSTSSGISAYSPLIFSFGLKSVNHIDHDRDHLDSMFEDVNGNGIFTDDDTDGDGRPNYADADDDGDSYLTKEEIRNPLGGFFDYPSIPLCSDGKKRHLSSTCHQP